MVPPPEESRKKMKKYTLNITAAMLLLWSQSHLPCGQQLRCSERRTGRHSKYSHKKRFRYHRTEIQQSRSAGQCHFLWKTIDSADTTVMSVWIANCWHLPICTAPPCK